MSRPDRLGFPTLCTAAALSAWLSTSAVTAEDVVEIAAQTITLEASSDSEPVTLQLIDAESLTDAGNAEDTPAESASAEPVGPPAVAEINIKPAAPDKPDPATERMQKKLSKLQLESQLRMQQLEAELASLKAENQRLQQAFQLAQQQQQRDLQPLQLEKARLDLEMGLKQSKDKAASAPLDAELAELQKQQQLRNARLEEELAELKLQTQKIQAEQALAAAERQAELAELNHQNQLLASRYQLRQQEMMASRLEAEAAQAEATAKLGLTNTSLQQRQADDRVNNIVQEELVYRDDPFQDGVLYISDRRIPLNGPIITGTADYVCERIDYYNNENPGKPIFLMIDNCPGGSVMQGYRIVKSIEASDAPVHVVVKSFAASMAAVITTLADHSYAYPNAIMLHHQMSAGAFGNMTDIEEQVETLQEWEARLAVPVAEKMGVTLDEFKNLMYENKTSGDWDEFADRAVELKWVNTIVNEVREEGIRQKPTGEAPKPWYFFLFAQDEHGQTYVNLPPAEPMDAYMMYNPKNFFRVDGKLMN